MEPQITSTAVSHRILCVDDDDKVLRAMRRTLSELYDVSTTTSSIEGVQMVKSQGPYAVVISDMSMPEMNGAKFLTAVKAATPHSTRILLSGQPDMEAAMEAINEAGLFRFLQKPCDSTALKAAVKAGADQYRMVLAEKELLERTLSGSIKMLTELMAILSPGTPGRALSARALALDLARALKVDRVWRLETAVIAAHLARVTLPPGLPYEFSQRKLERATRDLSRQCIQIGQRLLGPIPRLGPVLQVLADAQRANETLEATDLNTEARIVLLVLDYDVLVEAQGNSWGALKKLRELSPRHSSEHLDILEALCAKPRSTRVLQLSLAELTHGMVAARAITSRSQELEIVPHGAELTLPVMERLHNYARQFGVVEPIHVIEKSPQD